MRKKKTHLLSILLLFFAVITFSCTNEESKTRFEVRLTDAPGDFEEVNIDIKSIEINSSENEGGWVSLANVKTGVYNLLDFTNGKDTLLASMNVPTGKVSQIRLILGENNSVKVDGEVIPLKTPSAQQSGLKLKINADLVEGVIYRLLLDFDASRSIVKTANGYNLKPVIRAVAEAETGVIAGTVAPTESSPTVVAITGTDSVSTHSDEAGKFMIRGLYPGTYKVVFLPKEGFTPKTIENVIVNLGKTTDLSTVEIQ
ncbi:MAG TPA: DUF4382 domain-containing protein [Cytophagales bacterium]|nr:DUF4382 domain-containing protein [Cytophagales bacterium]